MDSLALGGLSRSQGGRRIADCQRRGCEYEGESEIHAFAFCAWYGLKKTVELLLVNDADVNAINAKGQTPLYLAVSNQRTAVAEGDRAYGKVLSETAALLHKHGGKTGEELKAAGN